MLSYEQALKMVLLGQEKAKSMHVLCCITIVDASGTLIVSIRNENAGFLTPQTSLAKAVASAAYRASTKELAKKRETNPAFWATMPSVIDRAVLPATGAVPLYSGKVLIGAVGVGGGSSDEDNTLAEYVAQQLAQ